MCSCRKVCFLSRTPGLLIGVTDAAQDISFPAMLSLQRTVTDAVRRIRTSSGSAAFVGAGTVNSTPNTGRLYIVLKPRESRKAGAVKSSRGCVGPFAVSRASRSFFKPRRTSRSIPGRAARSINTSWKTPIRRVGEWGPKLVEKLRTLPELADVASDQQMSGLQLHVEIDRTRASRLNVPIEAIDNTLYDAFGQRQISVIFTQLNQYRVVWKCPPSIEIQSATWTRFTSSPPSELGSAWRDRDSAHSNHAACHHPSGTVSFAHCILQSGNGYSLGEAVRTIERTRKDIGMPEAIGAEFTGSVAEFQSSLKSEPFLILAAIVVIYIVLGVLYESYIHPADDSLDAAQRGSGGASRPAALRHGFFAGRLDRGGAAHRHRKKERNHDD